MSEEFDLAVIGGGIVGLATAGALMAKRPGARIVVLEAAPEVGTHQSGHNSGVLHSGLYYKPGSLRARLCVQGRRRMVDYCAAHDIPHEVTGKLVVATEPSELGALDRLHTRGTANGLRGIRALAPGEWADIEPHVAGLRALWVPASGVTDYAAVTRSLAAGLEGEVRTSWPVSSIRRIGSRWELAGEAGAIRAPKFVACAGLQSDRVAKMAGIDPPVQIVPFRGEYHRLVGESDHLVRHLVYPVPDPRFPFLGVHFTRGIDGRVEVGPNAVLAVGRHHYRGASPDLREFLSTLATPGLARLAIRYATTGIAEMIRSRSRRLYAASARKLIPDLRTEDLVQGGAGVRAQALRPDGRLVDDFSVVGQEGALHVLNAPSPAATASLAIGEHLATMLIG